MGKKKKNKGQKYANCPVDWSGVAPAGGKRKAKGWLGALQGSGHQQFLLGAVLGAAATYVLSNDELREKIIRSAVKLYGDVAGGMAELKEQVADMQAELNANLGEDEQ